MIDSIGTSGYSASMMSGMRQRTSPEPDKISEKLLAKADADSDGIISKSEFTSLFETSESSDSESIDGLFSQMDSDGDGSVTTEEASIAISDLLIQQMQQQGMGNNMPPPPPPPANGEGQNAEELISSSDTDEDGSLDLSEFTEALKHPGENEDSSRISSLFNDADADGDGKVTQEELQAAMDNHHSKTQEEDDGQDTTASSSDQISKLVQAMLQQYQTNNEEISSILKLQA